MTSTRPAYVMPTQTSMVRRITKAFRATVPAHMAAGLGWYAEAYRVGVRIAQTMVTPAVWAAMSTAERDVLISRVVGVIAALSPRTQWSTNQAWTRAVIAAAVAGLDCPAVHTEFGQRPQAWAIANGADPLSVMNGPKIRAFYANIMGDTDAVTCDVWAVKVATGSKDERAIGTPARYRAVADAYRRAAVILSRELGRTVTPREVQAATWVAARGVKPTDAGFHAAAAAALVAA